MRTGACPILDSVELFRAAIGRRRRRATVFAVLASLALGTVGAVRILGERPPAPAIDQSAAVAIARDYFTHAQGAGESVSDVQVLAVALAVDDAGRAAWKVDISANVSGSTQSGPTDGYVSAMWLYVDAADGAVRIFAIG